MNVIEIEKAGGPEVLNVSRRPLPHAGPGEVLIRVAAAGVNRPDILQRQGRYPPPPGASDIPGLEVAGAVVSLGEGVEGIAAGDEVCALLTGGGYAEYCTAPAPQCLPIPQGLGPAEAAGIPETFFTVWTNVFERGRLNAGESFLVHGGTSGIGTTAIQLAKAFGARVFATAGTAEKCALCEKLGAERAIDHHREDFVEVVKKATGGAGVDVILDMVGGDYIARNFASLAADGRVVQIAFLKGARVELDLWPLLIKRLTFTGSTLRARPVEAKAAIAQELRAKVWPRIERGEVRPVIDRTFSLKEAAAAHRRMESGAHMGKIVLIMGSES